MLNKKCGERTEQFISAYDPYIEAFTCAFANKEDANAFPYALNTNRYYFESGFTVESDTVFYTEIRPKERLKLTLPLLHELIDYTAGYKHRKLRSSSTHNHCEIKIGINKKLSTQVNYYDSLRLPLHCPEFEKELPRVMHKLRKDVALQERLIHDARLKENM